MTWTAAAACRGENPELFVGPLLTVGKNRRSLGWDPEPALAICARCPVMVECREAAVAEHERYAIRGGVDFRQPRFAQRAAQARARRLERAS